MDKMILPRIFLAACGGLLLVSMTPARGAQTPFALEVWPQSVSVRYHYPVYLHIALQNLTNDDRFVRFYLGQAHLGSRRTSSIP